MHIPKNYFHDRVVLLLLSANTFLALMTSVLILLRLDLTRPDSYIVAYRSNLGLNAFTTGNAVDLIAFIPFVIFVLGLHTLLSMKSYHLRRHFSITILSLATLLLALSVIVSNALLFLR